IMIACTLVPKCTVDKNEIRLRPTIQDLSRGSHADEQHTAGCEQLIRDQYGKGSPHDAAEDPHLAHTLELKSQEICMVASPSFVATAAPGLFQMANKVAIRVEHTNVRHGTQRQRFLPAGFAE